MSFYAKDSKNNQYDVYFSSYWAKDVSPRSASDYFKYGVEPYGVKTNFNIPFRYVTSDSTTGNNTAYINKDLYYYNQPSAVTSSVTTYSTNYYDLVTKDFYNNSTTNIKSQLISATYTNSNPSYTLQNTFSFSLIQDDMPQLFYTDGNYKRWTANSVSDWFTGSNWYPKWQNGGWSSTTAQNRVTSSACPTSTKTYTQTLVSGGSNIDIESITLSIYLSYYEFCVGDGISYYISHKTFDPTDYVKYSNSKGASQISLTKSSPSKTITLTPTFSINSTSYTLTNNPVTIKAELSGTDLVVTITQPYGFTTLFGQQNWLCGLMETFEVESGKISMLSASEQTSITNVNFQYNNSLHPCYFWSPTADTGDHYGVLDCYSYYFPSSSTYYASVANSGCPVILFPPAYTKKTGQSVAYLQDGSYLTNSSLFSVYSTFPVRYINVFAGKTNYTEFYNYLLTDDGFTQMLRFYSDDTTPGIYTASSKTPSSRFTTGPNHTTLQFYASDKSTVVASMPITCYYINYYPLRQTNNYLYNDSGVDQDITIKGFSWSSTPQSYTNAFYCNSTNNSSGTVTIKANSSGYLTSSASTPIFYNNYTTTKTTNSTMSYTYYGNSYTLTTPVSYKTPTACLGYRFYYNNVYISSASVDIGTSSSYGSTCSITGTSGNHTSISNTSTSDATVFGSTTYFKINCSPKGNGRYNYQLKVYYSKHYLSGSSTTTSSWTTGTGTSCNPNFTYATLTFTDFWYANSNQNTYTYIAEIERTEISYPTITNCADNGWYKRTITVKNPNSFSVPIYYTSNKCTSSSSIDSGATWAYGATVAAGGTATLNVTDRSGWDDAYIAVGIGVGENYYCVNWYSEEVTSSPTKCGTDYVYHS